MAKFITGEELEKAISSIIWDAKEQLIIVSPFIKLDDFFIKLFEHHVENSRVHLLVVFGKNERDRSKSLNATDFDFFKRFPNVSIVYEPTLHAKYYGNEAKGVITSINMYDHSFKNNIEFGVYSENSLMDKLTKSSDQEAWYKCLEIAENAEPVFIKRPIFKKKFISALGKDYVNSKILLDNTDTFFSQSYNRKPENRKLPEFAVELDAEKHTSSMPSRDDVAKIPERQPVTPVPSDNRREDYARPYNNSPDSGFCIRTGVQIPFNPTRPFCLEAYRNWAQFENWDYSENFCHRTGKRSNGRTSMRMPILNQNSTTVY